MLIGYKAMDAFTLDYKVKWPLSLVISAGALTKYQMIFRHLFFCKHVERRLGDAWRYHQTTKEFLGVRSALMASYCLRQRMLHFQQNFVYYMMFEVISPRWHCFEQSVSVGRNVQILHGHDHPTKNDHRDNHNNNNSNLATPTKERPTIKAHHASVFQEPQPPDPPLQYDPRHVHHRLSFSADDILRAHRDFLDLCLKECLLTDPELLRVLTKLMTVCLTFANTVERFTRPYCLDEEAIRIEREAARNRRADRKAKEDADWMVGGGHKQNGASSRSSSSSSSFLSLSSSSHMEHAPHAHARRRNHHNNNNNNSGSSSSIHSASNTVDMRRQRIKDVSEDLLKALTDVDETGSNPFLRMSKELEEQFDTLLAAFMKQLWHRSQLEVYIFTIWSIEDIYIYICIYETVQDMRHWYIIDDGNPIYLSTYI
jgi:hypothetical protein